MNLVKIKTIDNYKMLIASFVTSLFCIFYCVAMMSCTCMYMYIIVTACMSMKLCKAVKNGFISTLV